MFCGETVDGSQVCTQKGHICNLQNSKEAQVIIKYMRLAPKTSAKVIYETNSCSMRYTVVSRNHFISEITLSPF